MSFPQEATQFGDLAPYYDELMSMVPYDVWVDYVSLLFSMIDHKPKRVLDCACGTGNVSYEMAARGWDVTGVDLSADMIEVAKRKSSDSFFPPSPRFLVADLTTFDLAERFDSATCLYDSLNYILDPAALQAAFERIRAHVEPDGLFVFDMNSDWAFEADLFTQSNFDPRRNLHYDWKAHFDKQSRICSVQMLFRRVNSDGTFQRFYENHRERAYRLEEVEAMLTNAGWQLLRAFDAYTVNPPHKNSERWYFVAKPA